MSVSDDPNAGQRKFWRNADIWVQQQERLDRQLAHIGLAAMDVATELSPGAHVLDVGCGCGQTSLQWSERVTGSVLGVDISDLLIDVARQRAATHAAEHPAAAPISFVVADAQTADMTTLAAKATGRNGAFGGFDVVFSRFGVMFFADPAAAFANVRAATRSGGQLAFACWQTPRQNPWLITVNKAVLEVVEMPEGDGPTVDPFAFADTDFVRERPQRRRMVGHRLRVVRDRDDLRRRQHTRRDGPVRHGSRHRPAGTRRASARGARSGKRGRDRRARTVRNPSRRRVPCSRLDRYGSQLSRGGCWS